MNVIEFIDELPKRIEWLKTKGINEISSMIDDEDYYVYFDEWEELGYPGKVLAKRAETIVFDVLVGNDVHKHYINSFEYELTDKAKEIRPIANNIYAYVIYLQFKNRLSTKAKKYCKQMENYLKHPNVKKQDKEKVI